MKEVSKAYPLETLLAEETCECNNCLPFSHTCDAYTFRKVLSSNCLQPSECPVYVGEKILYLFYGRPAYKKALGRSVSLPSLWPVSLLVKADRVPNLKRVLPFDSGGFPQLYEAVLHPEMKLEDFELPPNLQAITRFVRGFWENNEAYFNGKFPDSMEISGTAFEAEVCRQLCREDGKSVGDDRRSAIEAQVETLIPLESGEVIFVVTPSAIGEEPSVRSQIDKWGAEHDTYEIQHGDPIYATALIYEKVRQFLHKKSFFGN